MAKLIDDHLDYFKQLIEGDAAISFKAYWTQHKDAFEAMLPRAQFLRLKFSPIEEIEKILQVANVKYHRNATAINREKYYLTFDASMLDERGRLKSNHVAKLFKGAITEFSAGRHDVARKRLNEYIGPTSGVAKATQVERFQDLIYFAEIELKYGDPKLAEFLFDAIISRSYDDEKMLDLRNLATQAWGEGHSPA